MGLFGFFKKGPGIRTSDLENPTGLTKGHLNAILRELGRLSELDTELGVKSIRYVVDGKDEDVLARLAETPKAAERIGLSTVACLVGVDRQFCERGIRERVDVLMPAGSKREVSPEIWIRLGKVYTAAVCFEVTFSPHWPHWLVVLIREIGASSSWPVGRVERILVSAGLPQDLVVRSVLDADAFSPPEFTHFVHERSPFCEWDDYLSGHTDPIRDLLKNKNAKGRTYALKTLRKLDYRFEPLVDVLVEIGTGPSSTARDAALPALKEHRKLARPLIDRVLERGRASERDQAVTLLWTLFGDDAVDRLSRHLERETSERVRASIARRIAAPLSELSSRDTAEAISLPPVEVECGVVPLSQKARDGLLEDINKGYEIGMRQYQREQQLQTVRAKSFAKPKPITKALAAEMFDFIEGHNRQSGCCAVNVFQSFKRVSSLGAWFSPPDVKLVHVARMAQFFGLLRICGQYEGGVWWPYQRDLEVYRQRAGNCFGLRELGKAIDSLPDAVPDAVAWAYLSHNSPDSSFCNWEPEAVWPLFAEQRGMLEELLGPSPHSGGRNALWEDRWWPTKRRNAFRVLAMFPQLPAQFIPLLWDLALGENKSDRTAAQEALAVVPDKIAGILVGLKNGKHRIRTAAAEWLAHLRDQSAVEPLKDAFRREKQEPVRAAIMQALEATEADIGEFLNRETLLAEAELALKRPRPSGSEWVPLDSLPQVHWEDSGDEVDPRIVQWWVVQSIQHKSIVGGVLLQRHLGACRENETADLARIVLSSWIDHDTQTLTENEAAASARTEADRQWATYANSEHYARLYDAKKENLYQALLQECRTKCIGTAINEKGMLAIVSKAGDSRCVELCRQYIRKWSGSRSAQCRCLLDVLAGIADATAVQLLSSMALRFHTKGIRKAAEERLQELAERRGWTTDELSDRLIPDAGFERSNGEKSEPAAYEAALMLSYGPREFPVRLDRDLLPIIVAEGGKSLKNIPAPTAADNAEMVKTARKTLSEAKRTVKEVVLQQTDRLYHALCTQRIWQFDDWQRYLAEHPIVGRLCARIVWTAHKPGKPNEEDDCDLIGEFLGTFRPHEGRALTIENGEAVQPFDASVSVRVAHSLTISPELGNTWKNALESAGVVSLFEQFDSNAYRLPEESRALTDIIDFEGHILTTFQLRSAATDLGFLRGDPEDAGYFYQYRKPFPSVGLQAVIAFTGNLLPEEDIPTALKSLHFTRLVEGHVEFCTWLPSKMPLGEVPPVLLSECYKGVRQIAAQGTGFDSTWEAKCVL